MFLLGNVDSNLNCLFNITDRSIKFEGPLGLFGLIVYLTQEIVHKLMGKGFYLDFGNHLNHIRYHLLTLSYVKL